VERNRREASRAHRDCPRTASSVNFSLLCAEGHVRSVTSVLPMLVRGQPCCGQQHRHPGSPHSCGGVSDSAAPGPPCTTPPAVAVTASNQVKTVAKGAFLDGDSEGVAVVRVDETAGRRAGGRVTACGQVSTVGCGVCVCVCVLVRTMRACQRRAGGCWPAARWGGRVHRRRGHGTGDNDDGRRTGLQARPGRT